MSTADSQLDARLRDVPIPDGLLDRLMSVPLAEDADVDGLLRDVTVPPGLLKRLHAIALADDDGLDEALRNVPVPDDLVTSCHHHTRRFFARREGWGGMDRGLSSRLAMAASVLLAVTLSLGTAVLLILNSHSVPQIVKTDSVRPTPVENPLQTSWRTLAEDDSVGVPPGHHVPMVGGSSTEFRLKPGLQPREIELAEIEPSEVASVTVPHDANLLERALDGAMPGSHQSWDDLPELPFRRSDLVPHGIDWPSVPGSNRPFLMQTGFLPFVSPAAHTRLQTCQVPLAIEPSSYELARRYLERNEWPPADRDHNCIRTEEFLAAVDYNFPKPKNRDLGLIVAGGPSPISGEGYCLLQVGVQARQMDNARHAPIHLVLLVDTSTSMRWGSRLEIVRRALRDLPGMLGSEDRLTLVTFNQAGHVLVEDLSGDASQPFAAAVDSLSAEGATNVFAGLSEAYDAARPRVAPGPGTRARVAVRVVLLTDGLLDLEPAATETIGREVAQAAGQNMPLDVIDLGQQKEADPQVAALAQEGRGTVHRAVSARQVRWALREIVTGHSQVVARAARLQVTFNPKSVLEYRLVGHESEWGGLLPGPLEADFREGQAATALFEVRLAPNGPSDLASVELNWYAPGGPKTLAGSIAQTARMTVERKHFAASLTSSAPWLQEAAVVAYTTEVLRHSPFIFHPHTTLRVPAALLRAVELSGQVDGRLRELPSYEEFVGFIRREAKADRARHPVKD